MTPEQSELVERLRQDPVIPRREMKNRKREGEMKIKEGDIVCYVGRPTRYPDLIGHYGIVQEFPTVPGIVGVEWDHSPAAGHSLDGLLSPGRNTCGWYVQLEHLRRL